MSKTFEQLKPVISALCERLDDAKNDLDHRLYGIDDDFIGNGGPGGSWLGAITGGFYIGEKFTITNNCNVTLIFSFRLKDSTLINNLSVGAGATKSVILTGLPDVMNIWAGQNEPINCHIVTSDGITTSISKLKDEKLDKKLLHGNNLIGNDTRVYYPVDFDKTTKLTMSTSDGSVFSSEVRINYYDADKQYLHYNGFLPGITERTVTVPVDGVKFIKLNSQPPVPIMLNLGNTALPYEKYYTRYALTGEVDALTGEVDALTGEVDALTGEVVFPPTFEIDLSEYNSVKIYGTTIFYTYSRKYTRRVIQLADVPNTIEEASWDAVNSVLTINMPGESILLLDPIANTFTLQKNNWKVPTGKKVLLYRYYTSYGGLLFDTSFTRRFDKKVKDIIDVYSPKESLIDHFHEQIGHVYGAADYYRSADFIKDFTMLMISDTHEDNEEIVRAVEIADGVSAIDCLCHLGDIGGQRTAAQITSGKNKAVQFIQQANPQKPFFFAMGNHDEQNDAAPTVNASVEYGVSTIIPYINTASAYNARGYGYYDFSTYKIRMIILNSFDYPETVLDNQFVFYEDYICWQEDQANFLANTLLSTSADYTVIICSHWCELGNVDNTKINQHWGAAKQVSNNRRTVGDKTYMSDLVMSDIVNAYKNREALSKTYTYSKGQTSVSYSINVDFAAANGTFAIWLAGHRHLSGVAKSAIGDYWIYVNDTSDCGTLTGAWATNYTNMPRSRDSADTRDLMTCLSIDTGNRLLKFTRIGAHINRFLDDENYLVLSY